MEDRSQTFSYRIRTGYVEPLTELLSLQAQLEWSDRIRSSERDYKMADATKETSMSTRLNSLSGGGGSQGGQQTDRPDCGTTSPPYLDEYGAVATN
ncbi:hypothetical protein [Porphyromonas uenonis]|nr:hypothetical protein [Porphyromonas uenonis]